VIVAELVEQRPREVGIDDFGFLETQDVRLLFEQKLLDDGEPGADRN
jgi:hypothetical protein